MPRFTAILALCLGALNLSAAGSVVWLTDLEAAQAQGVKENKPILVDFTGSDWCPPCKALHKTVFESAEFAAASSKYVLLELDFPRSKPQAPEVKKKNTALAKKYGITGYPTVLLLDAKTGEVFGRSVGFGGMTAKDYLAKLDSYKNTPEGKASLAKEEKERSSRTEKSRAINQKINDAITAKDFKAAEAGLTELFVDASGPRLAFLHYNKARILLQIDPSAKEQALKYLDEALKVAEGDAGLTQTIKSFRDRTASAKPATDAKKGS